VYDITWAPGFKYSDVRLDEEIQFSVYNFEMADIGQLRELFNRNANQCKLLLGKYKDYPQKRRFPVLAAYDYVLKCSNLFNVLDARGAMSVTERAGQMKYVRDMAVEVAHMWLDQHQEANA
jgi:glycyl-tRNA synthetase alpha chain